MTQQERDISLNKLRTLEEENNKLKIYYRFVSHDLSHDESHDAHFLKLVFFRLLMQMISKLI